MYKTRPFFITLICLYLLIYGSYRLIMSFDHLNDPDVQKAMGDIALPWNVQVAMYYLNFVIMVVSAMFMFQEANWARWLYLGWGFVNVDYNFYIMADWHDNIIPVATYLAFALFLLLPNANSYFSSKLDFDDD